MIVAWFFLVRGVLCVRFFAGCRLLVSRMVRQVVPDGLEEALVLVRGRVIVLASRPTGFGAM